PPRRRPVNLSERLAAAKLTEAKHRKAAPPSSSGWEVEAVHPRSQPAATQEGTKGTDEPAVGGTQGAAAPTRPEPPRVEPAPRATDALSKLKADARQQLFARLGSRLSDTSMSEAQLHELVRKELTQLVQSSETPLKSDERRRLIREVSDDVLGYGPLQNLLDDDSVTEIMVNGPDSVYVEREGRLSRTDVHFASEEHLRRVIERIVGRVGRRIDES